MYGFSELLESRLASYSVCYCYLPNRKTSLGKKDGLSGPELVTAYRKWYAKQDIPEFTCFGSPASIDQEKYLVDKFVAEYLAS